MRTIYRITSYSLRNLFLIPALTECQTRRLQIQDMKEYFLEKAKQLNDTAEVLSQNPTNSTQIRRIKKKSGNITMYILTNCPAKMYTFLGKAAFLEKKAGKLIPPKCTADGRFHEVQCHPKRKRCWCVNEHGQRKAGTQTKGTPDCKQAGKRWLESIPRKPLGCLL